MEQIGWVICRLAAIAYWIVGLIIKYLWYAVPGAFKVIWNPKHAPTALILMLLSALDCKLYDRVYLGTYNTLLHLAIILAPFIYFYRLGKHKRNIVVNKTIVIKERPIVSDPIQPPINFDKHQVNEPIWKRPINQPESYKRHMSDEFKDAKEVDFKEVD